MTAKDFAGGQRWISEREPELGLGTVFSCDSRRVTLLFQASGEVRHYPRQEAPLRRVRFRPGHTIQSYEGWSLRVEMVEEEQGVLIYQGEGRRLPETELSDAAGFRSALERLLSGPRDSAHWFSLRLESLQHRARWESSPLRGLVGARLALEPKTLQLVCEVADREQPRVLLTNPLVGQLRGQLGWILHRRLCQQRGSRVLLLAPQAVLSPWARVLCQRFQLPFVRLDATHCQVLAAAGQDNPFMDEPLVMVATEWLAAEPRQQLHLLANDWDLLVVDQVQQLDWHRSRPGAEALLVAELCERVPSVLLLAPVGAGMLPLAEEPWLSLLEAASFNDPQRRAEQRQQDQQQVDRARSMILGDANSATEAPLDLPRRHSTAHLLLRQSLQLQAVTSSQVLTLTCPAAYAQRPTALYPEQGYTGDIPWWQVDPRVLWIIKALPDLGQLVVVVEHAQTGHGLQQGLSRAGVAVAYPREHQTPPTRDRELRRFQEALAQRQPMVLICSSPDSLGERRLPATPHLLWFDLPATPEGLLQRWAALPSEPLQLSVCYLQGTAQEGLYHWYRSGLGGFQHPPVVYPPLPPDPETLLALSQTPSESAQTAWQQAEAQEAAAEFLGEVTLWQGTVAGEALQSQLQALDQDPQLTAYLERLLDAHGLQRQTLAPGLWQLSPQQGSFPGVPDTGTQVTLDRDLALRHEEPLFLSWDHPMIHEAMDQLLAAERGNACAGVWRDPLNAPELLLEVIFVLECPVPAALRIEEFLPPTPLRLVVDGEFNELSDVYSHEQLQQDTLPLDDGAVNALLHYHRETLEAMLEVAEITAQMRQHDLLGDIHEQARAVLDQQIHALQLHRQCQPGVRGPELAALQARREGLDQLFSSTTLHLDALRLVVGQ